MYGCSVIQKALESVNEELQLEVAKEIDLHIITCIQDQNGNHVVQKCIETIPSNSLEFVIKAVHGQVRH